MAYALLATLTITIIHFLGLLGVLVILLLVLQYTMRFGISMIFAFRRPVSLVYEMAIAATSRLTDLFGAIAGALEKWKLNRRSSSWESNPKSVIRE